MTHCLDMYLIDLKEDIEEQSSDIEEILSNCDLHTEREVKLPKVVG